MNPSNTSATPEIKKVVDSSGNNHSIIPTPHTHSQSEVTGLTDALAAKAGSADMTTALAGKMNVMVVDSAPANNADHLVSSKGVYDALSGKANSVHSHSSIDSGEASVSADGNTVEVEGRKFKITLEDGNGNEDSAEIVEADLVNLKRALQTPDSTPTTNSTKFVLSGGVKAALDGKMNTKAIDSTPTTNSTNLVTSGGVKAAIDSIVIGSGFVSTDTVVIPSGAIVKPMPLHIIVDDISNPINLDPLFSNDGGSTLAGLGMVRLLVENGISASAGQDWATLLESKDENLPIHTNAHGSATFDEGEFVILTAYKLDKSEGGHEHDSCYFVTLDGIFDAGN